MFGGGDQLEDPEMGELLGTLFAVRPCPSRSYVPA
jgi:hypothetical protein